MAELWNHINGIPIIEAITMPDTATTRPRRRAVSVLYGLAAALLLLGLALGRPDARRHNRIPLSARMLSSALVLAAALLLWKNSDARSERGARLIAGGMGCGLLGDLVMAEVIPLPQHVACGMLAFGAGHALYMRAFLEREAALRATTPAATSAATEGPPYRVLGVAWALALSGWWALVRNPAVGKTLNYGSLVYSLLLASMSGLAASLAARDRRYAPAALGGALFLASDMILARELFRKAHFAGIGDVIWLTYIVGQALIVATAE
jgi:YhhN family